MEFGTVMEKNFVLGLAEEIPAINQHTPQHEVFYLLIHNVCKLLQGRELFFKCRQDQVRRYP